jgi:hypothetical protein
MEMLFAAAGMILNVVRGVASAKDKEPEFNWLAWLGERPVQVALRALVTLGVLLPEGMELAQQATIGLEFSNPIVSILVPLLIGRYGDRVAQPVLEKAEEGAQFIPILRTIIKLGKKLT